MQVPLQRVLVEGAAQPGAAAAQLGRDVAQGVEALQLVAIQMLLHVEPESQLWARGQTDGGRGETKRGN